MESFKSIKTGMLTIALPYGIESLSHQLYEIFPYFYSLICKITH